MKKSIFLSVVLLAVTAAGVVSCKKDMANNTTLKDDAATTTMTKKTTRVKTSTPCGVATTVALIAGQNYTAGTVSVSNDATNLYVTYTTTGGWTLKEMHLYAGDCALIPTNGPGNPVPGRFPYAYNVPNNSALTTYTFTIPLTAVGNCFCVAAHAVVSGPAGTQTAWGAGTRFVQQGNWGTYFSACKQSCITCVAPANVLFGGEAGWPGGATSVVIGGYTYTQSQVATVYYSPDNDSKNALILIATLKVSAGPISLPAAIQTDATTVEAWLASLAQQDGTAQYTAPTNVKAAIDELYAWEAAHTCAP
ncbi:MAG: hypothetical protein JST76_07995 [Bacteroidetes bacterium]|nr:hypothetical protein [Bacteroidota bacterium]